MATKFITVSIEIMHDEKLNQSQKFLLAEIEQLSQLDKGCIASNNHFSELIGITKENVSKNINDLAKKGYINIEIVNGSRNHTRIITITTLVNKPYQSSKTPLSKQQETKENKTINITVKQHPLLKEYLANKDNVSQSSINYLSDFINYRTKIKKPIKTVAPLNAYIKALKELWTLRYNLEECINTMKENEWQTLKTEYIHKENTFKGNTQLTEIEIMEQRLYNAK